MAPADIGEAAEIGAERATKRPLGTDFGSLTNVSWSHWNSHTNGER